MLRAQIMHSFLHLCSNHTPDTSQNVATLQLKPGATQLFQTQALLNAVEPILSSPQHSAAEGPHQFSDRVPQQYLEGLKSPKRQQVFKIMTLKNYLALLRCCIEFLKLDNKQMIWGFLRESVKRTPEKKRNLTSQVQQGLAVVQTENTNF